MSRSTGSRRHVRFYAPEGAGLTPTWASLLAIGGLLAAATPASALTISGTTVKTLPESTPLSADERVTDIIYNLDLHAGPTDERFSVRLAPGAFSTEGGRDEGQSVDGPLQFGLYGPGTVGQVVTDPAFATPCSDRDRAFHGYSTGAASVDVHLPAGANTTLAIRYKTGRRAPWIDTDLRLGFTFQAALVGQYDAASPLFGGPTSVDGANTQNISVPVPVISGGGGSRIGAHLLLKTVPAATYGDDGTSSARRVSAGKPIRVEGRLLPASKGKRVDLLWRKPGGPLRTAKTIRTGQGGRWTTTLRLPGKGTYELWANYPTQPGSLAKDTTSCPLRFNGR